MQALTSPFDAGATGAGVPAATKAKLLEKAKEFEQFYIYQFLELTMSKSENPLINGGAGEEMFRHNLNEQMAKNITQQGGFGVTDAIYRELLKRQEVSENNVLTTGEN